MTSMLTHLKIYIQYKATLKYTTVHLQIIHFEYYFNTLPCTHYFHSYEKNDKRHAMCSKNNHTWNDKVSLLDSFLITKKYARS